MFSQQDIIATQELEETAGGDGGASFDPSQMRYKVVHDPIHKSMTLPGQVLSIADTPEFQRLRDLKQLGVVCWVYPTAGHSRFEHSLGVSYVSGCMIDHLAATQPILRVTNQERVWVQLAGLVHDLGHGPFSHVFDGQFVPQLLPGSKWSHEDMSVALLDLLVDENSISFLDDNDGKKVVQQMVFGAKAAKSGGPSYVRDPTNGDVLVPDEYAAGGAAAAPGGLGHGFDTGNLQLDKPYLFEIVANGISGVDTDKFDYLKRDSYGVGVQIAFDYERLVRGSRVIESTGHIGFHVKEAATVYDMFATRHHLFRQIYVHRATKAVEFMITDILLEANNAWDGALIKAIEDPREYVRLSDSVLYEIEHGRQSRNDPRLAKAHSLLKDLRKRHLYRFIDEHLIPKALEKDYKEVTPEDIAAHNDEQSLRLDPRDIIVHNAKFNYGKGEDNPVDSVTFYVDWNDKVGRRVPRDKISHTLPVHFQERIIRVYSRNRDVEVCKAIQRAFRTCLKTYNQSVSMHPDPSSRVYHDVQPEGLPSPAHLSAAASYSGSASGPMALDAPPRSSSSGIVLTEYEDESPKGDHLSSSSGGVDVAALIAAGGYSTGAASKPPHNPGAAVARKATNSSSSSSSSSSVALFPPGLGNTVGHGNTPSRGSSNASRAVGSALRNPAGGDNGPRAPTVPSSAVKAAELPPPAHEERDTWGQDDIKAEEKNDEDEDEDGEISASQPPPNVRTASGGTLTGWLTKPAAAASASAPSATGVKRGPSSSADQLKSDQGAGGSKKAKK